MRKLMVVAALAVMSLSVCGCAAVLVGGLMYDHTTSREDKRKFESFNAQNLEREKAGLPRLDWCSEVYKYSKSWANEQPGCAERIKRFEAGDTTALQA